VRAVALLLALSFGAWVGAAHGQTPRSDSVVAQGTTEEFEAPTSPTTTSPAALIFDINATSGPSGENAGGHVALDLSLGVHWDGQVTCLNVLGNRAIVGAELGGWRDTELEDLVRGQRTPRCRAARQVDGRIRGVPDPRLCR
jgi:hypothetical protein